MFGQEKSRGLTSSSIEVPSRVTNRKNKAKRHFGVKKGLCFALFGHFLATFWDPGAPRRPRTPKKGQKWSLASLFGPLKGLKKWSKGSLLGHFKWPEKWCKGSPRGDPSRRFLAIFGRPESLRCGQGRPKMAKKGQSKCPFWLRGHKGKNRRFLTFLGQRAQKGLYFRPFSSSWSTSASGATKVPREIERAKQMSFRREASKYDKSLRFCHFGPAGQKGLCFALFWSFWGPKAPKLHF